MYYISVEPKQVASSNPQSLWHRPSLPLLVPSCRSNGVRHLSAGWANKSGQPAVSIYIYIYTLEVQRLYFDRLKSRKFPFRSPSQTILFIVFDSQGIYIYILYIRSVPAPNGVDRHERMIHCTGHRSRHPEAETAPRASPPCPTWRSNRRPGTLRDPPDPMQTSEGSA